MNYRGPDVLELERLLNEGGDDNAINQKAIETLERLKEEGRVMGSFGSLYLQVMHKEECDDFNRVIAAIRRRRHAHVLDQFDQHVSTRQTPAP